MLFVGSNRENGGEVVRILPRSDKGVGRGQKNGGQETVWQQKRHELQDAECATGAGSGEDV